MFERKSTLNLIKSWLIKEPKNKNGWHVLVKEWKYQDSKVIIVQSHRKFQPIVTTQV